MNKMKEFTVLIPSASNRLFVEEIKRIENLILLAFDIRYLIRRKEMYNK